MDAKTGFIHLGASNPSSIKRMAIFVQNYLNEGKPIPRSAFAQYVAKRITHPTDKQDFIGAVAGPRGSGKSYSCLYLLVRISEEIAKILGGKPTDYFDPNTNVIALEDAGMVSELLANKKKFQCILIDDSSVSFGHHDWNSKASKNFIKICTTMRTRRWCILVNAPQIKTLDNSFRDFIQVSFNIVGSFHVGGFNLIRANLHQIGLQGKTYYHKLRYDGVKIDLWAAMAPPREIVESYDRVREESAIRLNERIAKTGSSEVQRKVEFKTRSEKNAEMEVERYGEAIRKEVEKNPTISVRQLSAKMCLSAQSTDRILAKLDITLHKPVKGANMV